MEVYFSCFILIKNKSGLSSNTQILLIRSRKICKKLNVMKSSLTILHEIANISSYTWMEMNTRFIQSMRSFEFQVTHHRASGAAVSLGFTAESVKS